MIEYNDDNSNEDKKLEWNTFITHCKNRFSISI